ncbi:thiamine phosphate synthase [Negativibacillus massiliensis]|uniref:thiamine phosphate synthase n=1 Tax=Negativibacillus massiliensis TaxID=1871035 RepID=UPI00033A5D8F|nr:thiamine phosphate synthase [Negativibacillus massiliensis]CDA75710.1 thiamine-phosphate synthase [Clostridium sp. CAG:242]
MNCDKKDLLLYAVTDRAWLGDKTLSWQVEESLKGGATMIQLREKHLDHEHFLKEAKEIKELCRKYQVPFLINDDVDLAVEVDADGVHVGQHDMEAGEVRKKIGPNRILGVSAQTVEQALLAQQAGADYLGVGAVFPTGTKDDADAVSIQTLGEICRTVSIPVVAIGGIGQHNVMQLAGSGICGIAVVSAIYAQPDIQNAASTLHALAKEMVER